MKSRVTKKTHYLYDISYCFLLQFLIICYTIVSFIYEHIRESAD